MIDPVAKNKLAKIAKDLVLGDKPSGFTSLDIVRMVENALLQAHEDGRKAAVHWARTKYLGEAKHALEGAERILANAKKAIESE